MNNKSKNNLFKKISDEMFITSNVGRSARVHCGNYWEWFLEQSKNDMHVARKDANLLYKKFGVTYTITGGEIEKNKLLRNERIIPFDLIPRILSRNEWGKLEEGLIQRIYAINAFLKDAYHEGKIFSDGIIPPELIYQNSQFRHQMIGRNLPDNIYAHISGTDLIRNNDDNFYVLEDNLRVPSGISYMLENRKVMMRLFPDAFKRTKVAPIDHYPDLLLKHLKKTATRISDNPNVVILTPGQYNSAYFEHSYLANQMGIELVEGQDLFLVDNKVYMKTTSGSVRVDVIYRRLDDDFLDPLFFRPDSVLGVPGIFSAIKDRSVIICNAVGTGIADDKSVYPYVPDMIKYYLGEEPLLRNVKTFLCRNKRHKNYVLANLHKLVVKKVHGAGGVGMLVGPLAGKEELLKFKEAISNNPEGFIAQPLLALSTSPVFTSAGVVSRHVDLRSFTLHGKDNIIIPGGLTRVALKEASVVVNSSQGGGTKDTWVSWS